MIEGDFSEVTSKARRRIEKSHSDNSATRLSLNHVHSVSPQDNSQYEGSTANVPRSQSNQSPLIGSALQVTDANS